MMDQLKEAMTKLAAIDKIRDALYHTLTKEQQIAVSKKVSENSSAMADWIRTYEGSTAIRYLVDEFINSK